SSDIDKRRYLHDVVYHDKKLILFGGGTKTKCFGFEELDIIDLNDHKPTTITTQGPAPTPRKFQSVVRYFDEVFVIGGWSDTPTGPILSDEVWKLSLSNMTWSKCFTSLRMPHFFHASSITPDGCLFTFGGCIDKSMYPSNNLQRAWIRPPKLQYLTMFNFLKNNAKLAKDENEHMKYSETIEFMQKAVHYYF
uniref:Uncharacterized protein n=1 Tax=Acrobeloides nanus TaxID=290746 RepID=A0A914C7E5_9BILA